MATIQQDLEANIIAEHILNKIANKLPDNIIIVNELPEQFKLPNIKEIKITKLGKKHTIDYKNKGSKYHK